MDQCVPEIGSDLPSTDFSPLLIHAGKKSREIKSPAKLHNGEQRRFKLSPGSSPSASPRALSTRPSPSASDEDEEKEMLTLAKRRKLNYETPSYDSSPCNSPAIQALSNTSFEDGIVPPSYLLKDNFGESTENSAISSPAISPSPSTNSFQTADRKKGENFRGRYKKDELWPAIEDNYQFLMDKGIIETCRSTESDLSWESDDLTNQVTNVSYNEFQQQYKELTDWLTQIQAVTERQSNSLSEKYLNQSYHEEMLQRSPRRKLFNDYAKQLMRRYPNRKDEVVLRLQHLNKKWQALETAIASRGGKLDQQNMLQDLEKDLSGLSVKFHDFESRLQSLELNPDWTNIELLQQLQEHQVLQCDLQAQTKIVSAILKLCQRLDDNKTPGAEDKKLLATTLERRWHVILLQALEWQLKLEEAIKNGIKKRPELSSSPESDDNFSPYASYTSDQSAVFYHRSQSPNSKRSDENGQESDTSSFDVIPFSESEYEKITVDTDVQTDEYQADVDTRTAKSLFVNIPRLNHRRSIERCDGMDYGGTDSALGRSVSDHSLNTDVSKSISYPLKLSQENLRPSAEKCGNADMRIPQKPYVVNRNAQCKSLKVDSHDIGYSSESHSTEEPELNGNFRANSIKENVKLRVCNDGKAQNAVWRYSMTSAYDSSSNSENVESTKNRQLSPCKGEMDIDLAEQAKVSTLLSSPSQNFYHMTTIETDSEATNTADNHMHVEKFRDGAATDGESELSHLMDLPYDDVPVRFVGKTPSPVPKSSTRMRLDAVFEKLEPIETPIGSPEEASHLLLHCPGISDSDQSMDEEFGQDMSDSGESNALFDMESMSRSPKFGRKSHKIIANLSCEEADFSDGELNNSDDPDSVRNCVNRLLRQAKLLARDSNSSLKNLHSINAKKKEKLLRKKKSLNRSFTSTDGSALPTDESAPSAPSMCEASDENTESSESESEFSSTGSDSEDNNISVLKKSISADVTLCQNSPIAMMKSRSISSQRKIPHGTDSSDLEFENARYSVSESAINDLQRQQKLALPNLSNSTSELPCYAQSTPKLRRRRRLRKSNSSEVYAKLSMSPATKLTYSQSLPSSRRLSSKSHSRSLSPSSLELRRIMNGGNDFTSDSCSGAVPIPLKKTDDDHLQHSFTSGAEFSENAWDNLHHIYPPVSSDPGEEKLDASEFQKDWDFQNNCHGNLLLPPGERNNKDKVLSSGGEKNKPSIREKRISSNKNYADDSDSDLEDIHYVIDDSRKAIKFTENTLRKFRKDNMETGIFIDPSEYDGPLETCKEHIVCLEEIRNVLNMKTAPDADLDEIQDLNYVISKWQSLGALAAERQKQSSRLAGIYNDLMSMKSSLQDMTVELDKDCFDCVTDLEHSIKILQESKLQLNHQLTQKVAALVEQLNEFEEEYPAIKMARFDSEVAALQNQLDATLDKCTARASELQAILLSWYDFGESRRELEYLLQQEKQHLSCLENADVIIAKLFSVEDLTSTIHDLQALDNEMGGYEKKLREMRQAQSEIAKVYSQTAHKQLRTNIDELDKSLQLLRSNCRKIAGKIEKQLKTADKQIQVTGYLDSSVDARLTTIAQMDEMVGKSNRNVLLWRLIKVILPVQLAVVVGFCLLCLYDPTISDNLTGLVFSPTLTYVDGPPPV